MAFIISGEPKPAKDAAEAGTYCKGRRHVDLMGVERRQGRPQPSRHIHRSAVENAEPFIWPRYTLLIDLNVCFAPVDLIGFRLKQYTERFCILGHMLQQCSQGTRESARDAAQVGKLLKQRLG